MKLRHGARDAGTHIVTAAGRKVRHGTHRAYVYYRCPCDRCRSANTQRVTRARRRRGVRPASVVNAERRAAVEHGSQTMYDIYRCHCDICRAGSAARRKLARQRARERETHVGERT